jgi:hypothetical protein
MDDVSTLSNDDLGAELERLRDFALELWEALQAACAPGNPPLPAHEAAWILLTASGVRARGRALEDEVRRRARLPPRID